jgi:hypothetical protein
MTTQPLTRPITREALLGTWSLQRTFELLDGQPTGRSPIGEKAHGFIHYMPGSRMSVMFAHEGHPRLSNGRYKSPDDETARSSRTFCAYAGTFTIEGNDIIHHLEISDFENDRGTDYLRHAALDGNSLTLVTPSWPTRRGEVAWGLEWHKLEPADNA